MKLKPIVLSVKRGAFRGDNPSPPGSDAVYKKARSEVLKRDNFTCAFCGFRHPKNEVHHIDDNHDNHALANLITACVLCHMAHHLAYAGIQKRGTLIYLDDVTISQGDLNQLVRTLWVAEFLSKGDLKNTASSLLARLEKAELMAAQVIGTSSPSVMGDFMFNLSDSEYKDRGKALQGIYLLPSKEAYKPYIKMWAESCKSFTPNEWVKRAEEKFDQWSKNS